MYSLIPYSPPTRQVVAGNDCAAGPVSMGPVGYKNLTSTLLVTKTEAQFQARRGFRVQGCVGLSFDVRLVVKAQSRVQGSNFEGMFIGFRV